MKSAVQVDFGETLLMKSAVLVDLGETLLIKMHPSETIGINLCK